MVGGGITGLMTAYYLQKKKRAEGLDMRITLIEAAATLGGKIQTVHDDEFVMEAGADSIVARKANVAPIVEELGLQEQIAHNATGRSFLFLDGRLRPIPEDTLFGIPLSLESLAKSELISAEGKVEALKDFYTPNERFTKDDSVGEFLTAFLGEELVERQIAPVLSGVYSGSLDELTIASTMPYLLEYKNEYGSILKGLEVNGQQFKGTSGSKFLSFTGGLSTLIEALEQKLDDVEIVKGTRVQSIVKDGSDGRYKLKTADGSLMEAEFVALAVPHAQAQRMLHDERLSELFASFKTSSLISVYMGFDAPDDWLPQDGTGFINANGRALTCNACTWTSRKWTHTSRDRRLLIRMFYKSSSPHFAVLRQMTEEELLMTAREDLKLSLGIEAEPVTHVITKWLDAMPKYDIAHHEAVRKLETAIATSFPNVVLAGCSYYGVGIPDCMESGRQAAEQIIESL